MADEKNQNQVPPVKSDETKNTEQKQEEHMIPKSRFDEVNNRAKEAEEKLAALASEKAEQEKKALEESGKFKELYEKEQAEKARLQTEVLKRDLIQQAITNKEIHPSLTKMIQGTTEDEIKKSLEDAKTYHKEIQEEIKSGKTATDDVPGSKTETQGVKGVDEWVDEYHKDPKKAYQSLVEETNAVNK